jgi:hypothetical protein
MIPDVEGEKVIFISQNNPIREPRDEDSILIFR